MIVSPKVLALVNGLIGQFRYFGVVIELHFSV